MSGGGGRDVGATVRAGLLSRPDEAVAGVADLQGRRQAPFQGRGRGGLPAADPHQRLRPWRRDGDGLRLGLPSGDGLEDQRELAGGERLHGGLPLLDHPLAQPALFELKSAIVAVRVVAGAAEEGIGGPGAAAAADLGVIAGAAVPPEVLHRAQAAEMDRRARIPDLLQREIADVAARVADGGEKRAPLDGAVRLQNDNRLAGAATGPVAVLLPRAAPEVLVGAEITDVVAGDHQQAAVHPLVVETRQQGHELEELVGLEQEPVVVHGVAHGHRELKLPVRGARRDDPVQDRRELLHRAGADLGVDAGPQPRRLGVPQGLDRHLIRAGDAADLVVQLRQAVDRDAEPLQAGLDRLLDAGGRQVPGAALHGAIDAVAAYGADDLRPIPPQVGLAADQADLPGAQAGELIDDLEALFGAQLVGARPAGPGPAVLALEIAGERDLPDDVDRDVPAEVVVGARPCGTANGLGHDAPRYGRESGPRSGPGVWLAGLVGRLLELGELQIEALQGGGDVAV